MAYLLYFIFWLVIFGLFAGGLSWEVALCAAMFAGISMLCGIFGSRRW